jgi:peptidoglycan/xylan/chitin deacetylase (PgdA/CDA1 family)
MYHYVRELEHSRFPQINGLSIARFIRQLDYIQAHYTPITVDALRACQSGERDLPSNALLLTFDDGYVDHFTNVFPLLEARGIQGCFFPPAEAIVEHKVLDVNKIHFILASESDVGKLLNEVIGCLHEFRATYELKPGHVYREIRGAAHRYDPPEVTILKRLLQRELPEEVRTEVVRRLFAKYVTVDEAAFASELYMSLDQIVCLRQQGMHIGSHGYSHAWLNHLPRDLQTLEIDRSLEFLRRLGVSDADWTMCYPYGGFDHSLLQLLKSRQCRLGFGVEPRMADLDADDPLTLPRFDTNDLPS